MINVEELLKPIAEGKPCGEDFSDHLSLQALETLARGKPETQSMEGSKSVNLAEEPDWKEVQAAALDLLKQSRHLSAGVILTLALLKTGGMEGLRDGLAVLRGLVEKYWSELFPKLDPEDKNDPTQRVTTLSQFSSPAKPYQFTLRFKQILLCASPRMGKITLEQFLAAKEKNDKEALAQFQAGFREAWVETAGGSEAAKIAFGLVNEATANAQALQNAVNSNLEKWRKEAHRNDPQNLSLDSLLKLLREIKLVVEPFAATSATPSVSTDGSVPVGTPAGPSGAGAAPVVSGEILNRADVIKSLDRICDYYRDREPSSPVPLILKRALRLVEKDFMAIMTDLNPDALKQIQVITGTKPEK